MASGYTSCPCCGYDTISDDVLAPEVCSDCEDAGCAPDGTEVWCDHASALEQEFASEQEQLDAQYRAFGEALSWLLCPAQDGPSS